MSFDDLPLFASPALADAGERGKAAGMQQVWAHAAPGFREAALEVIYQAARHRLEISANDLWDGLAERGITTHDNRASGPVMTAAARRGWIVRTERTTKTTRPSRNKGDVRIWRSLIVAVPD
jgi:hypothetical protein